MNKKDGLEIYELFRTGPGKSATAEVTPPPQPSVKERVTAVRPAPAPAPATAKPGPGEAMISVRLNTALVGLMVGTATLFGAFALGVQYERRHRPAPVEVAREPGVNTTAALQPIAREIRRESPPAVPAPGGAENRTTSTEPKRGFTLQLMSYGSDQESIAQTMLRKVKEAGGLDASIVKNGTGNFIVVAGFVEKQSGAEADAVLTKYRGMADRINKPFNLNWIGAVK
ncbi:MAG: hypothetical protein FD180_4239 [Planctomycetota bacterium]|nr:MAG: hypothetical protein FD180_4239 [Planctomycetota bacterium]